MNCAERPSPRTRRTQRQPAQANWRRGLPAEWCEQVIEPFDVDRFVEYEMAASRCLGYDIDGGICFYSHDYAVEEPRTDDDEEFYRVVTHGETVRAWRLRDGRWLIFRQQRTGDDCTPQRGFFILAETPPGECRRSS
jgi:hypothetical protein